MFKPVYQVVDLVEVNEIAEKGERLLYLCHPLASGRGPDFGGDNGLTASSTQDLAQHMLGSAIHGGGVKKICLCFQCDINNCTSIFHSRLAAHIKRPPRSHPNRWHL